MLKGCYYRCPIAVEAGDDVFPRFFVLAQVVEYNELADTVKVKMHDLLGSSKYHGYSTLFQQNVFRADAVTRCEAMPGEVVDSFYGRATIVSCAAEPHDDDQPYWYWIKISDGRIIKECETSLKIEYSRMNYSPVKQFRSYEFQHPTWFINRLKVSRNLHLMNHATYGFDVLAGCRVFLMPHQISTVARCFETMPIRYMLADEVGLGKTVEACSILRILASENKKLRTLLIVPGALAAQWKSELHYKFNMEARIHSPASRICIVCMEEISKDNIALAAPWDLVIIDETHRLLKCKEWYERVQSLSQSVEHILLLSATPIQDRNEEYHQLLALLNPKRYADMSPERFSGMVRKQQRIQQKVNQQLNRLERYDEYKDVIFEKLIEISDTLEDSPLKKLVNSIDLNAEDHGLDLVKQALAYICENYRLERKVIRNRRQLVKEKNGQTYLARSFLYTSIC